MSSRPAPSMQQTSSPSVLLAYAVWCVIFLLAALAIIELKPPNAVPGTAAQNEFSAERALTHVRAIARAPHPIGSTSNNAAREYILAQLSSLGMNPQVVTAVGVDDRWGPLIAGKTHDIVARTPGTASSSAIVLMAHYDSVPSGPGAADDAAAVAAILETVRAVKTGAPLRNDFIVLVTDGEEAGLLGAEAFVASHPWMKDLGLLMNFEARGDRGPSLLFETSANNAALINGVAQAAPYPIGSSFFYSLYKLLPNDTDFTVFRPAGTPGLNFAFGNRLEAYHSSLDTADNLDTGSLQHHGSYALALVRYFGEMDLTKLKQQKGDDIFFDWIGSNLIAYSTRWILVGEVIATLLLILAIILGVRRSEMQLGNLVRGVFACFLVLLAIPLLMAAAGWLLLLLLRGRRPLGDTPANSVLLIGLSLLAAALGCAFIAKLRRRFNAQELWLAGLVVICILSWALSLMLPAGSYLLFWPLLLATIGLLALAFAKKRSSLVQLMFTLPEAAVTILLFAPIAYLLYVFLTLNLLSIIAVGLIIGLFFLLCLPLIDVAVPQRVTPTLVLPLLAGTVVCLGVGIARSHPSPQHPRADTLLYSFNADDHTAAWISSDQTLDSFTSQYFGGKVPNRQPNPNYLTGSQTPIFSGPATAVDLPPPISEIKADEQRGNVHQVHMNVRSQRDAGLMILRFDPSIKLVSVKISGRELTSRSRSGLPILLYGMGNETADLELTLDAPSGVSFWISDYSDGLPTTQRRAPDLIAAQGSDETLVCRKYTVGTMK